MTILNQPSDIIQYICTFLDKQLLLQLWSTCKCTNKIISERVPITYTIDSLNVGLRLINLFKRVRLEVIEPDDSWIKQLGNYISSLEVSCWSKITDDSFKYLVKLTTLKLTNNYVYL